MLADFRAVLVPEQVWREAEHHRPDALEYPGVKRAHLATEETRGCASLAFDR